MILRKVFILGFIALFLFCLPVRADELLGTVVFEGSYFFNDSDSDEQSQSSISISVEPQYYRSLSTHSSIAAILFARMDNTDDKRSHWDIREMVFFWHDNDFELNIGVNRVFWGVTEFVHLIDIINQTDLVENIDAEDKLGQPMINVKIFHQWGLLDMFLLPLFRERTFPGPNGRLRSNPPVNTDRAEYESDEKQTHLDVAVRYAGTAEDWDFGLYYFTGTGREPILIERQSQTGESEFVPFYPQINQIGLDIQSVKGNWLLKLEALHRIGLGESYSALIGGFEYTWIRVLNSAYNVGWVVEWAYDERGSDASTAFQNDALLGIRFAFNDAASTEILMGFTFDLEGMGHSFSIEASGRLNNFWSLSLESRSFFPQSANDPLYRLRDDDYVKVLLSYHF